MRRWVTLLVFGVLIATAFASKCDDSSEESEEEEEEDEGGDDHHGGYVSQRIDDSAFRLERLEAKLNDIKSRISEDGDIDHAVDVKARLNALEGGYCGDNEFACGGSNPSLMCISSLLACDGTPDCPNGGDEEEDTCKNRAEAGEIFKGRIHWSGCKARGDSDMTIKITANKQYNYFPARVWLGARTTFDYGNEAHSFDSNGYLDFGKKRFVLAAPVGEHVDASCDFVTDDIVDCTISSMHNTCAEVRLVRQH